MAYHPILFKSHTVLHLRGILGCIPSSSNSLTQRIFTKHLLCAGSSLVADNIAMHEADSLLLFSDRNRRIYTNTRWDAQEHSQVRMDDVR